MIITDSNKNDEKFGETKTFNVQAHSAEELKNNINIANEKHLRAKSKRESAENKNSGAKRETSRNLAANPQLLQRQTRGSENDVPYRAKNYNVKDLPQKSVTEKRRNSGTSNNRIVRQNTLNSRQNGHAAAVSPLPVVSNTSSEKPASVHRDVEPVLHSNKSVTNESRNRMTKTINTDLSAVNPSSGNFHGSSDKSKKIKNTGGDEGGNTVVSVVKAIVYIIFVIVISAFLAAAIIVVSNDVFAFVKSDEIVEINIPEYATLDDVSEILYKNDIIKYPKIFKMYAVAKKDDGEFLAGTYSVSPMMNYGSLLNEFKEKITYATVNITIPEGYTTDEIIDLFVEGYGIGTREGFVDVIENYEFDYWFIKELSENGRLENRIYRLDGYLFPDTYQFYTTTSEVTVIDKMLKRFSQIFTKEYRKQCEEFGYSVDEMITLASMIEREAESPAQFFNVSSVFHNRLNNPWNFPRLESDATVLYVLKHESDEKVTVTADDLHYDTPYNTYLYDGLPPGPIANPSASAMLAALSPASTNYYYFVANKGITYFSSTKSEHDAYIAEFKKEIEEQQTVGDVP